MSTHPAYLDELQRATLCENDVVTFLHNTKDEEVAKAIIEKGFGFYSHLDYTTDIVSFKDPVTIKYFTIVRSAYGQYTVVIQISREVIEEYSCRLDNIPHHFSEVLSLNLKEALDEELNFILAPCFVKGYLDASKAIFYPNPAFNPFTKLTLFDQNLEYLFKLNKTTM